MFDEPSQAELGIAPCAAGDPAQYRVPKAFRGNPIEITDPKSAFLDCLAQPAGYRSIFLDRDCCVALRTQSLQKGFAMRPRPSRLVSPFAARIPRDCHMPLLSSQKKRHDYWLSEDQIASESDELAPRLVASDRSAEKRLAGKQTGVGAVMPRR
jgi:hypothetical protein